MKRNNTSSSRITYNDIERFNIKYKVMGDHWIWMSTICRKRNTPSFRWNRKNLDAKKFSIMITGKGKINEEWSAKGICNNKLCVNPDHIKVIASSFSGAKFTKKEVRKIRQLGKVGMRVYHIAKKYDCIEKTIKKIMNHETYCNVR